MSKKIDLIEVMNGKQIFSIYTNKLVTFVDEIAEENPDLVVAKINVDEEGDLALQFKVMSIPTLVVMKNGEEVNRSLGVIPKDDVLDLMK